MRRLGLALAVIAAVTAASACGTTPTVATPGATAYAPTIDPAAFSATVDNPFLPVRPGMRWEYRSTTADGAETTLVTVTSTVKTIMGVPCIEVRDTVSLDGVIKEDTLDWYAQHRDGTVWYFGEDTKEFEDGKVVSTKGSWTAGIDGAQPGIVMPAQPKVGEPYRQEYYQGHAEDMAEVVSLAETATVPSGSSPAWSRPRTTPHWTPTCWRTSATPAGSASR